MAADMVLQVGIAPLLGVVFDKVGGLIVREFALLGSVDKDLCKLFDTVSAIRRELRCAAGKKIKSEDTRNWVYRLEDVAKEAVEILNQAFPQEAGDEHSFPSSLNFNCLAFRHTVGRRIKRVTQKFDALSVERSTLDFEEIPVDRETGAALSELNVIGREKEAEVIINKLLSHPSGGTDTPSIYSIIGHGGIGKTTLVQWIIKDARVVEKFKPIIWVWVSETFHVKTLMRKIIENISGSRCKLESLDTMQKTLKESLEGKKFLLVLDDVWNEDQNEWNNLNSSLRCGAIGSSILLTTRQSSVTSTVGLHHAHKLSPLSEDYCWSLFKKYAFTVENGEKHGELEAIGREIVKKCGGFPLVAKSLGSSLRSTQDTSEWLAVRDSDLLESGEVSRVLKLSSDRLVLHSRNCFAFTSIFPKGHKMGKQELIHLWMANDLVPSVPSSEPEDMGNKIFNDLVSKSFLELSCDSQDLKKEGHQDFVKMHDLMHELAWSIGTSLCSEGHDVYMIPHHVLHLRLAIDVSDASTACILKTLSRKHPFLRTCILVDKHNFSLPHTRHILTKDPDKYQSKLVFKNLDSLRALDLSQNIMTDLPKSIGKMKNLKFLNLSMSSLTNLPNAIRNLTSLQTLKLGGSCITSLPDGIARLTNLRNLDLSHCRRLAYLPEGITRMRNLRNLDLSGCEFINLPRNMGRLVWLRKLDWFVVGQKTGKNINELGRLNQLRGKLEIKGLENVRHAKEAEEAKLKEKKSLSSLSLIWGESQENNYNSSEVKDVLDALQPPQSLNGKLVIGGYRGFVFANWMKLLKYLVKIELEDCINCETLPPLGGLPCLKVLVIVGLKSLKCISTEFYSNSEHSNNSSSNEARAVFPLLEELRLEKMPILEGWHGPKVDEETSICPRLEKLVLTECPNLKSLPCSILSFLQQLEIYLCDKVVVKSLPCLTSLKFHGFRTSSLISFPDALLQNLVGLKYLSIVFYDKLICLPEELLNITSLRTLDIYSCPALQSLPVRGSSLVEMTIDECHSLTSLSQCLHYLSSLERLNVSYCGQLEISNEDFDNLVSLQHLELLSMPKLVFIPEHLSKLQTLRILDCNNLVFFTQGGKDLRALENVTFWRCERLELSSREFQNLFNLRTIDLDGLPKLISLPELQPLNMLQHLSIHRCQNLKMLSHGLANLSSLKSLNLGECEQLELASGDFQHLINLVNIVIYELPKLTSLPKLQHLRTLKTLRLRACKNLKMLLHGLQYLLTLQELTIRGCHHELHLRCEKDKGEYWDFISDIPQLELLESEI